MGVGSFTEPAHEPRGFWANSYYVPDEVFVLVVVAQSFFFFFFFFNLSPSLSLSLSLLGHQPSPPLWDLD